MAINHNPPFLSTDRAADEDNESNLDIAAVF